MSLRIFCLLILFVCLAACTTNSEKEALDTEPESLPIGMVSIPGGTLSMGGDNEQADANEYPKHQVQIAPFFMDRTEVTNRQFKAFVEATGYHTTAEQALDWEQLKANLPKDTPKPPDSILQPGALVFVPTGQPVSLTDAAQWWHWRIGANWRHPEGPQSSLEGKMDHPVVQVSWDDAQAYCQWADKRLPTEAEWEWAARGGLIDHIYPWGNEAANDKAPKANFWQGLFPFQNSLKDGYTTTAPVKSFPPNGYGLYDMPGNVWEWCSDWFDYKYYAQKTASQANTKGPLKAYNPSYPYQQERVIRGGSFLCNDDYCSGYRNARRMGSSADTGLNHTGFRTVKDRTTSQ